MCAITCALVSPVLSLAVPLCAVARLYTVTITACAALLVQPQVAAIVWAPAISDTAEEDNTETDILIIPRKTDASWGKSLLYYFQTMVLSGLIGHTVRLALLSNLAPPEPGSRGITVSRRTWKWQVFVSITGLFMLGWLLASFFFGVAQLRTVLLVLEAHW